MKGWKYKVDNKLRSGYGETDFEKKVVKINKKRHKSRSYKRRTPNKDGSENMMITMLHEINHTKHPNMKEKSVEKLARAMKSRMTTKQKGRIYSKFQ